MRSQAKASTAGSNSGKGVGLGALLVTLALCFCASVCLIPGSALAAGTRPQVATFGPAGTSGASFSSPTALTFDQGNKRLYALDQGSSQVYGFDASAPGAQTPLGGSFPLSVEGGGETPDIAADSASHNFYYLSEGASNLYGFDASGGALGGNFPLGAGNFPCGAAVDPSGNIWIGEWGGERAHEFNSSGSSIGSVSTSTHGNPCHIAFDPQANLYVAFYEGATWKYSAASGYADSTEVDSEAGFPASALTVDRSTDNLYVVHATHVSVFDPSGAFLYEFGFPSGVSFSGIAIDEATDRVYVSDAANGIVRVFGPLAVPPTVNTEDADAVHTTTATLHATVNPNGDQLTDCHFEYVTEAAFKSSGFTNLSSGGSVPCVPDAASIPADSTQHAVNAELTGLAQGTAYRFRIAAANAAAADGVDRAFITGPPAVSEQKVESVGTADATLSAKINPKGLPTTYHVEYGTTASYGQSTAESAPIGFPLDNSAHTVSVHIGGLTAGIAYHFRFVATSSAAVGEGTDISFATYPASAPAFGSCSNDQFRTGFAARLPDCRAYEQVTPADKNGANARGSVGRIQASRSGDRITFYLTGGLPTTGGSSKLGAYMASRGPSGWSSDGLLPPTEPGPEATVLGWSDDLSRSASIAPAPGATTAIYLRDSDTAAFQFGTAVGPEGGAKFLAGFAADTSHLIFEAKVGLLPGVPAAEAILYDLDHGALTLPGRIPAGSATSCDDANGPACVIPAAGSFAGPPDGRGGAGGAGYTENTISRDGSRVFFGTHETGQLYVRENGTTTTQISASQAAVPDPNGHKPAAFVAATPDGSTVFFLSCEKLTDDSTAVSTAANTCTPDFGQPALQGQDLYSYDVDSGELTDLSVDSNAGDPLGAAVQGVLGTSEDGSYVYFAASGVLAPGASLGGCPDPATKCNVYLYHDGTTTFIASLLSSSAFDSRDWVRVEANELPKAARVAPDGSVVLFASRLSLTGYSNAGQTEFYRYSAADKELACVSCNPTGLSPSDEAKLGTFQSFLADAPWFRFLTRNFSADGKRAFFESPDALLPTDTNGVTDVYEWEAEGSGSCNTPDGCLYLLSSGTSPDPSYFGDASADGSHVFVFTSQQLVPGDHDQLVDVYDAGVGAGLAAQHALSPPTCTGTACQANPPPPPDQAMASATFQGPGNAKQAPKARKCPKGKRKVRRGGKVSCQKAHKQHKRHTNRGGSK